MDSRGRAAPAWVSGRRPPHPSSPSGTESSGQGSSAALGIRRRLCTGEDVAGVMRLSLPVHTVVMLRPPRTESRRTQLERTDSFYSQTFTCGVWRTHHVRELS